MYVSVFVILAFIPVTYTVEDRGCGPGQGAPNTISRFIFCITELISEKIGSTQTLHSISHPQDRKKRRFYIFDSISRKARMMSS